MKILGNIYIKNIKNITSLIKIIVGLVLVIFIIYYLYNKYLLEQEIYSSYNDKCNTKHLEKCDGDLIKTDNPNKEKVCCPPYYCNNFFNKCMYSKYLRRKFLRRVKE